MKNTRLLVLAFLLMKLPVFANNPSLDRHVRQTMKSATRFMMDKVSYQGGFVWQYLPNLSRSWGELEARRSMVWIQPTGTPSVGLVLVEAYEATNDPYYLKAALKVAKTLIKGQLPCGGWNYVFDLQGEDSLKTWYETVGRNAWRLEEFQHYYGNATFDDGGTIESGMFLLRLHAWTKDKVVDMALERVIGFVQESQYPNGGWPQRYPLMGGFSKNGASDYTGFITLNDDVMRKNIDFLLRCNDVLGRPELKVAALKAMYCCRDLQQKGAYPGWADQYTLDGKPAHARSYEPRAINTATTVKCVQMMLEFYHQTGDSSFLAGIPKALDFVESLALSDSMKALSGKRFRESETIMTPRFIDPDNGTPFYVHRKGSNVVNGRYYTDQDIRKTLAHYSSVASFDLKSVREAYAKRRVFEERNEKSLAFSRMPLESILKNFDPKGYWPAPLMTLSNPYIGAGPSEGSEVESFAETMVGDRFDTSCYNIRSEQTCISTGYFIFNMQRLIRYLQSEKDSDRAR